MTKNIRISFIFAVILMGLFLTTSAIVRAEDAEPAFVPTSEGSNDAGDSAVIPNNSGANDNEGDGSIIPNNQGSNGSEGDSSIIPNGQGENGDGNGGAVVNPPVDNGGGNTDNGSGNESSGSSRNSNRSNTVAVATTPISAGACVYLNDYLKIGNANNSAEVLKLQIFLKNTEKINVAETGIFDDQTFEAVKAFQAKYVNDIMQPWGVSTPTGQVFYTTKKKINEIFCNAPFALTAEQQAQIDAYKASIANGTIIVNPDGTTTIVGTSTSTTTSTSTEVGSNTNGSQAAAVGGTSIGSKIWGFIKWLFGY